MGKFTKGTSGNPRGRPRVVSARERLVKQAPALMDAAVELALSGDKGMLMFLLGRLLPQLRAVALADLTPGGERQLLPQRGISAESIEFIRREILGCRDDYEFPADVEPVSPERLRAAAENCWGGPVIDGVVEPEPEIVESVLPVEPEIIESVLPVEPEIIESVLPVEPEIIESVLPVEPAPEPVRPAPVPPRAPVRSSWTSGSSWGGALTRFHPG